MNNKLQEFAKDSLFYAVGHWMGKLGGLIMVPILSRIFLPGDYGVVDLLNTSYQFTLMAISLNIDTGVQKFYYLRNENDRKVLLSSTMVFRFCLSGFAALLAVACSEQLSRLVSQESSYTTEIGLLAAVLAFEDMNSQLMLLLRLNRKVLSFSVYNVCQVVIQPVLTYLCVVTLGQGLKGVFTARLLTVLIITTPLLLHQRKYYSREVRIREAFSVMKFSLPGLPAILQGNAMTLLPRYILAYYSGLTVVGLYGIADKIANTIEMFKGSFNRAWNPFAFANAGQADEKSLYEKVFRYFSFFLLLLITFLTVFAREILWLLTPPKYYSAAALVGGVCVYYSLRALVLIFSTGLYSVNKVAQTSLMAMIQLTVFLAAASILVPKYNAAGLVISLDVAAVTYFFSYGVTVKKYFPFSFSSGRLIVAFVLALCCGLYAGSFSGISENIVNLGIIFQKSALWCLYALLGYCIIFTRSERKEVLDRVKSFFSLLYDNK